MRWLLPPLWFDLCWELGRFDEQPFPLAVRSHGATLEERAALLQRTLPELRAAGLVDGSALDPAFARALDRISKPSLWIEGIWMPDAESESPARLLSVATEDGAVVVEQFPGETEQFGGDVRITEHPRTSLAAAAVQGMPPAPPGTKPRVAVPLSALGPQEERDFSELDVMSSGPQGLEREVRELRRFVDAPHLRDGQFTANHRDRLGRAHRSPVLQWFDAFEPDGRYGLTGTGTELVLAPLGPAEIGRALDNRVQEVRAAGG
ncbi:ESX secretion-associated protein EspG [Saccharopolyspora sp. CA-218241]|uniref:ESX secretion-associated protein EspG n=1 Tax=Saccharopolyspora sp. CA-218241 TaxID=3240027 RepID=UPI003D95D91F